MMNCIPPSRGPWTWLHFVGLASFGALTAVIIAALFGWAVRLLWNWLMPDIFGLSSISYWQGFGLMLLARLLFGSVGGHHPGRSHRQPHARCNWRHFDDWWHAEGRAAFEEYLETKNERNGEPGAASAT